MSKLEVMFLELMLLRSSKTNFPDTFRVFFISDGFLCPDIICCANMISLIVNYEIVHTLLPIPYIFPFECGDYFISKSVVFFALQTPLLTMSGHTECISSVQWMSSNDIVSGSWDHSVRIWDLTTGVNKHTLVSNHSRFFMAGMVVIDHSTLDQMVVGSNPPPDLLKTV